MRVEPCSEFTDPSEWRDACALMFKGQLGMFQGMNFGRLIDALGYCRFESEERLGSPNINETRDKMLEYY